MIFGHHFRQHPGNFTLITIHVMSWSFASADSGPISANESGVSECPEVAWLVPRTRRDGRKVGLEGPSGPGTGKPAVMRSSAPTSHAHTFCSPNQATFTENASEPTFKAY